jgi:predicted ArsR family transcriptional regulator
VVFIGEHPAKAGDLASPLESRTRSRVLHMVSAEGPITAAELGRHLDLTPAAVRRHLDALVEQGAVAPHEPPGGRRGRGRPARAYVVSEAGHRSLEADYDSLAVEVLRYLSEHGGPQAVADFARSRVGALEDRYAAELAVVGDDPAARAETLVDLLSRDGFAASARPVGTGGFSGVQLCQGHCPVQHAAEQFPTFCEAETDAFSRLLGVHVQRLATLAGGDHVCTTFVPTAALASGPASGPARKSGGAPDVVELVPRPEPAEAVKPAQRHTTSTNEPTKEGSRS